MAKVDGFNRESRVPRHHIRGPFVQRCGFDVICFAWVSAKKDLFNTIRGKADLALGGIGALAAPIRDDQDHGRISLLSVAAGNNGFAVDQERRASSVSQVLIPDTLT